MSNALKIKKRYQMQPEKFCNENESRLIVFLPPQPSLPYTYFKVFATDVKIF